MSDYIKWFDQLGMDDVEIVGGKNASLGEMIQGLSAAGVRVPGGFATTAHAYRHFLAQHDLGKRINVMLSEFDVNDVNALADVGKNIRQWIMDTDFPDDLREAIITAYKKMQRDYSDEFTVAVRSSATAEDLPDASFAGQQETILNVSGI
ncbi:MAG: phosphoenolpyruvate synthase, partial [Gammaproteobacteria bacterium]|nr:phosphoenolpyruvate synthase [Gammaproteobacteria bacterium]